MFEGRAPEPATQPTPRSGRLIGLVRQLIDYGFRLARTVRQCASPRQVLELTGSGFGTTEVALIVARITRGLRLAGALEERLIRGAARLDRPATPAPTPAREAASAPAAKSPARRARTAEPPPHPDPAEIARALLERMPSEREIAAQIRRRPIGAVLADICADLGLNESHPLWRELCDAVTENGGSFLRLMRDLSHRVSLLNFFPPDTPIIPPMPAGWKPPATAAGPP
jgi:hypothetical protein